MDQNFAPRFSRSTGLSGGGNSTLSLSVGLDDNDEVEGTFDAIVENRLVILEVRSLDVGVGVNETI